MSARSLLLAACVLSACHDGADALVVVTLETDAPNPQITALHGTVTSSGKTGAVDVLDKTGAFFATKTTLTFALQIPSAYAGPITVTVEARDALGNVVASGTMTGTAKAGERTTLTIALDAPCTVACGMDMGGCDPGQHACPAGCLPDDDVNSCGTSCDPCPTPQNSTNVTCTAGACGFSCAGGFKKCGMDCVAATDCCAVDCPPVAHGTPSCASNSCSAVCDGGFKLCAGECIPDAACCTTPDCPVVANGSVTCETDHSCSIVCAAGYVTAGLGCDVAPPRLVSPISGSRVASRRPRVTVALAPSTDDALIDICSAPTCPGAPVATFLASVGVPALDLPAHKALFVRAHGIKGGITGAPVTAAWELFTPGTSSASKEGAVTTYVDLNRDGYADLLVGANASKTAYIFLGSAAGVHTTPDVTLAPPVAATNFGNTVAAGDLDGDGFPEVIIGSGVLKVFVWKGGPTLLVANTPAAATIDGPASSAFGISVAALGDYNGDGYGDFAVGASALNAFYIFAGSATGIVNNQVALHTVSAPAAKSFGTVVAGGDVNCDGKADVLVGGGNDDIFVHYGVTDASYNGTVTETTGPASSGFGLRVASAGDVNNDGCADVAVGESAFTVTHQGFVALGGSGGLGAATATVDPGGTTNYGVYTSGIGNVGGTANGYFVVSSAASLYVYEGAAPGTLRTTITITDAAQWPFGAAGDLNGDGYDDMYARSSTNPSSVYVLSGSPSGFGTTVTTITTSIATPMGGGFFGSAIAWLEPVFRPFTGRARRSL